MVQCKLCEKEKELKKSHIISRFLYRYLLSVTDNKINQFDGQLNLLQQSNRQLKKKLLCSCCEQLLGDNEAAVSEIFKEINDGNDKNKFAYGKLDLKSIKALERCGYEKSEIDKVLELNPLHGKISILEYFSMSYIYRELLYNKYSIFDNEVEKIRSYLLGDDDLPFMLHIRLNNSEPSFNLFTTVIVMDGLVDWKHFVFYIPNMQFHIALHVKETPNAIAKTLIIPSDFKKDEIGSINLLKKFQDGSRISKNPK